MNVTGSTVTDQAVQALTSPDAIKAKLQIAMLQKTLQAQLDQASELLKMTDGKGQQIDIRV